MVAPCPGVCLQMSVSLAQVRLMKRIAEMTDIRPVLRKLPRIQEHVLHCDNMR